MRLLLISLLSFWVSTLAHGVKFSTIEGDVSKDFETIDLLIVLSDIKNTEVKLSASKDELLKNLGITLGDQNDINGQYPILPPSSVKMNVTTNDDFKWEKVNDPEVVPVKEDNTKTNITYKIKIRATRTRVQKGLPDIKRTDKTDTVIVRVSFYPLQSDGTYDQKTAVAYKDNDIERSFAVPTEAPKNFTAEEGSSVIEVTWDTGAVAHDNGKSKTPSQVILMAFVQDAAGPISFKTVTVTDTPGGRATNQGTCTYNSQQENCIVCDPKTFLDTTQDDNDDIAYYSVVENSLGKETIAKCRQGENCTLSTKKTYNVVMQYPEGLATTKCIPVKPINTISVTVLNGADPMKVGDPRCFIVSASFGSSFAKFVDIFRWARETFLMPFEWGRNIVDFYYDHRQPLADRIKASKTLQYVTRGFLWPLAFVLYSIKAVLDYPALMIMISFILFLSLVYFRRFRRRSF